MIRWPFCLTIGEKDVGRHYTTKHEAADIRALWEYLGRNKGASVAAAAAAVGLKERTAREYVKRIRSEGLEAVLNHAPDYQAPEVAIPTAQTPHKNAYPLDEGQPFYAKWVIKHDSDEILILKHMPDCVLAFACLQVPFNHFSFIRHVQCVAHQENAWFVVIGGDLLDLLFGKPEFGSPDGLSPTEELHKGMEAVAELARAFPNAIVLTSNHIEERMKTMQKRGNLPAAFLRQWRDIYGVPHTWKIVRTFVAGNFLFEHGHETGKGARSSIREETVRRFKMHNFGGKTVIRAHRHGLAGSVMANEWETPLFNRGLHYMGCGMDEKQVSYSGTGLWNTCLVIDDCAVKPYPMEVGPDNQWTGRIINGLRGEE
jgi:hypothetical protein